MPVSFDWEFEEKEPDPSLPPGRRFDLTGRQRRRLLWGAVLLLLLLGGGLLFRLWVNQRMDAVEKVEAELRGVVELEIKSIIEGDSALFRDRQDPFDPSWRARQVTRYVTSRERFVPVPGLTPAEHSPEIRQVHVQGGRGRVELTYWFQPASPLTASLQGDPPLDEFTGPLPFHATWFYRQDDDGVWHHIAPPEGYWGVSHTWYGTRLEIQATETEAQLLDPIAGELASLVSNSCRWLNCPPGERYVLSFDDALAPRVRGTRWTLPALYLTGMPQGQGPRGAWKQALERWLIEALAQAQTQGSETAERLLYRQLVTRLQAEFGLVEQPVPDVAPLAQALRDHTEYTLQELWALEDELDEPGKLALARVQGLALLQWLEMQVGSDRLLELLPAMSEYQQFDAVLTEVYDLDPGDFRAQWLAYLSDIAGVSAAHTFVPQASSYYPGPPPEPLQPTSPPGDQIALLCDNRVWVVNADGSDPFPLTDANTAFKDLHWSPDGRWLLTTWLPGFDYEHPTLYVLAAEGGVGRVLVDDPSLAMRPLGWSPDGREVVYLAWKWAAGSMRQVWATDVETGVTSRLPGVPLWSPDGERVVFAVESSPEPSYAFWLADVTPGERVAAHWEGARQVVTQVRGGWAKVWSPDGTKLALVVEDEGPNQSVIILYDVETMRFTYLATPYDLLTALRSLEEPLLGADVDRYLADDWPLPELAVVGWSADGNRLLVRARWQGIGSAGPPSAALVVVPVDGSAPRPLAVGHQTGPAAWSPTDPDRLALAWGRTPNAFIVDLGVGLVYTETQGLSAAWSPQGEWVAFSGMRPVVVDQQGEARFELGGEDACGGVVWNPTADLSALGQPIPLELDSMVEGWDLSGVRAFYDPLARELHGWGEMVNRTGADQRITAINYALGVGDNRHLFSWWDDAMLDADRVPRNISLADGQRFPFSFSFRPPDGFAVGRRDQVLMAVRAEPGEPVREDFDVLSNVFDASGWPERFDVRGSWSNPGPDLTQYVALVVTLYGEDGRVLGWGWQHETDPTYLAAGEHRFEVRVQISEAIAERSLAVASYKLHLFGR